MLYFRCTACGHAHQAALQLSREEFECREIEDRQEMCPIKGRMVLCSKWLMYWGTQPIPVRLSPSEAEMILTLADNGSFPQGAAAITAAGKIRAALARDPERVRIDIDCSEDEVEFLQRSRLP